MDLKAILNESVGYCVVARMGINETLCDIPVGQSPHLLPPQLLTKVDKDSVIL